MGTRVSYPIEIKMKAIEIRLAGIPVKQVLEELNIKNHSQLKVWMKWYRSGEMHRLNRPVGKQYLYELLDFLCGDFYAPVKNLIAVF